MDPTGVTVRPARPDAIDARAFARLLDQAQEGWFRMALGRTASATITEAFCQEDNEFSHRSTTVAEVEGEPVGMVTAYSGEERRGFGPNPIDLGHRRDLRYRAVSAASSRMLEFLSDVPPDDYYVRAIAVDAAQRGKGVGTVLLEAAAEAGRDAGCRRLALDVAGSNRRARGLYERLGMVQAAESARFLGLANTNVRRMVRDL